MSMNVAAVQMAMTDDLDDNASRAEALVRRAAADGAQIVLLPELFEGLYFCKEQDATHLDRAHPIEGHPTIERFAAAAAELGVVIPVSVFERAGNAAFNSVAMIDADGSVLGVYRKSHIPDGPGYCEKFYFTPGDTGFRVWATRHGHVGVGICWDQWFPEAARAMALMGAEVLMYPTAIGSEPADHTLDSSDHWRRVMIGHAAANLMPVVAANRIGTEQGRTCAITFYGSSFIVDHTGDTVATAGRDRQEVLHATFDREALAQYRRSWGLFRDRRPDLYGSLLTFDGEHPAR